MKHRALALTLLAAGLALAPGMAASDAVAAEQHVLSCGLRVSSKDLSSYPHLKCMVGTAVAVSTQAMRVRPAHGAVRRLRFTRTTRFETNSGEGALNGLAVRDQVCVAYTSAEESLTARIVAFNPRSMPCRSGKNPTSGPEDGGHD